MTLEELDAHLASGKMVTIVGYQGWKDEEIRISERFEWRSKAGPQVRYDGYRWARYNRERLEQPVSPEQVRVWLDRGVPLVVRNLLEFGHLVARAHPDDPDAVLL